MKTVETLFKQSDSEKGYFSVMINDQETYDNFLDSGWVKTPDDFDSVEIMSDEERELRDEYEKIFGKKAGGRSKIETIRAKIEEQKAEG